MFYSSRPLTTLGCCPHDIFEDRDQPGSCILLQPHRERARKMWSADHCKNIGLFIDDAIILAAIDTDSDKRSLIFAFRKSPLLRYPLLGISSTMWIMIVEGIVYVNVWMIEGY